jgi:catechol 2,3-dioxygenase-like lactoylglutathione lyase family enzyme
VTHIAYLSVADDDSTWERLGFTLDGNAVRVGSTTFTFGGASSDARGITSWVLLDEDGIPEHVDGLPTSVSQGIVKTDRTTAHPNGITAIDHLVVATPDVDRTVAAFEDLDWECRRRREGAAYGQETMRQAFFWLGDVIVEVVGPQHPKPEDAHKPASFFGIAFTSQDLDATQAFFGDLMKPPVPAVQAGRFITTVSSRAGSSLAIAVMSPHVKGSEG